VSSNTVVVSGEVQVPNLPALNQPDPSISNGYLEGYIALFSATNGSYLSAVYLGGSGDDYVSGLKVDAMGDIIVAGYTSGPGQQAPGFPVTDPLPSGPDPGKSWDAFVTKLHPPNLTLTFSTLLGGPGDDYTTGLALDPWGNVLITGYTGGQFPMVNAFQPELGGGVWDAFLLKLSLGEKIQISRSGQALKLSWPVSATGFVLESAESPVATATAWTVVPNTPVPEGDQNVVTLEIGPASQFFRLKKS
jgi:hypothetical protein